MLLFTVSVSGCQLANAVLSYKLLVVPYSNHTDGARPESVPFRVAELEVTSVASPVDTVGGDKPWANNIGKNIRFEHKMKNVVIIENQQTRQKYILLII